jgi:hypothetical protein
MLAGSIMSIETKEHSQTSNSEALDEHAEDEVGEDARSSCDL